MRHFSLKTHYKCIQTPIWALGSKWPHFEGYTPRFGGRTPSERGFPGKPYYFWKRPPRRGGSHDPILGGLPWISLLLLKKYLPEPIFGGYPHFWVKMTHFFGVLLKIMINFGKNPPKTVKKRFFHCKHTHFWKNWPILGGTPHLGGIYPPKKRQKRTLFNSSQSSYRAKSNQSSSNFMKPQSRALLTRILKEKMPFFPRVSLGKVVHRVFWRKHWNSLRSITIALRFLGTIEFDNLLLPLIIKFWPFFGSFFKKIPWISVLLFFLKKTLGFPYYFFSKNDPPEPDFGVHDTLVQFSLWTHTKKRVFYVNTEL